MEDKISVIMSVYKEKKEELEASIYSILNQTYTNIEFIIVIDFPEEQWRIDYIKSIDDLRIKLIINEKNIGLPNSLNEGLKYATGKYIARMDADDISIINRLEIQKKYIEEKKCDLCGSNIQCFFENTDQQLACYPRKSKYVNKLLIIKNCIAHPTYFAKAEVFKELNGYRNIFTCEDYDFLLRALNKGFKLEHVQETLLKYRLSKESISRANPGKQELIAEFLRNNYKNNKEPSIEELEMYLKSNYSNKKLKIIDK